MPYQQFKSEVGYRNANHSQTEFCRVCRSCSIETHLCTKVSGRVDFGWVCDLFERDPKRKSLPPRRKNGTAN